MVENYQQHKEEETKRLIQFVNDHNLWVDNVNIELYVSQGAEQKVYLKDGSTVLKLNDAIYYASWIDYLHNLLPNNLFFPDTAYQLLGFYNEQEVVHAVVEQPFGDLKIHIFHSSASSIILNLIQMSTAILSTVIF